MDKAQQKKTLDVVLRCLVFVLMSMAGTLLFGWILNVAGYLLASVLGVFLASTVANAVSMRIFERASLAGVGLYWNADSIRNLVLGLAGGIGAACLVILAPIVVGAAQLQAVAGGETNFRTILYVSILLLFGSAGEEMLFRGYAFQKLIGLLGPFATILPIAVLFAWAHSGNQNVTVLALVNTFLWGVILGWAFIRAGDLWLPIGLHFGWNWVLPLLGVNLSGLTMKMTGFTVAWKAGPFWSGGDYGPEGSVLTCGVLVLLFLYLWKAPIRKQSAPLLPE